MIDGLVYHKENQSVNIRARRLLHPFQVLVAEPITLDPLPSRAKGYARRVCDIPLDSVSGEILGRGTDEIVQKANAVALSGGMPSFNKIAVFVLKQPPHY